MGFDFGMFVVISMGAFMAVMAAVALYSRGH